MAASTGCNFAPAAIKVLSASVPAEATLGSRDMLINSTKWDKVDTWRLFSRLIQLGSAPLRNPRAMQPESTMMSLPFSANRTQSNIRTSCAGDGGV
jgi:hypothetical protein